jgi:UDP-2-acetamido-2-deoxy-ribo-hexuluronate aminotransferase
MSVPFFTGSQGLRRDWPDLEARLRTVAARGRFTSGPAVEELERSLARRTGAGHVVAVGNGTDALALMLRAAGIGSGDEVIVPAYTFVATASAVCHVGAEPVMVDILPGSYAIDVERAAAAVTARTKAIMPVHLFSQMADMAAICELADAHGFTVLEDSAEGIGMALDGRSAGLWGQAGVLSFFPTKTLGALGDAGAVLTDDGELAAHVRRGRVHGQGGDGTYLHEHLGINSRCDEIQATVLHHRLDRLDADISRRAELADRYTAQLAPLAPRLVTPWLAPTRHVSTPVFYVYLIETERRDELVRHLSAAGIGTEVYYPRPLTRQPCFAGRGGTHHPVPVATSASRRALALPLYPDLADDAVDHVCAAIHRFFEDRP